ncbi:MAG: amidohydrolase family protein [Acidimicrobiales bacterium]
MAPRSTVLGRRWPRSTSDSPRWLDPDGQPTHRGNLGLGSSHGRSRTRARSGRHSWLVCAHHHFYSALVRCMPAPPQTPNSFRSVLEQIWWRVDTALDLEMLEWSAKLGALEALESGCTAIIDHHESPNAIEGSLSVIADACAEIGVRVNCAYGVTDRHGPEGAKAGLAENDRFLSDGGLGMVGLHAAFTCTEDNDRRRRAGRQARRRRARARGRGMVDTGPGTELARRADYDWLLVHGVNFPTGSTSTASSSTTHART